MRDYCYKESRGNIEIKTRSNLSKVTLEYVQIFKSAVIVLSMTYFKDNHFEKIRTLKGQNCLKNMYVCTLADGHKTL